MNHPTLPPLLSLAGSILAGPAHSASLDIARRALMLVMRLLSLREQEPFVNMVIDKIPRQQLVVGIVPSEKKVGAGQRQFRPRIPLAINFRHLGQDTPAAVPPRAREPFEDTAD